MTLRLWVAALQLATAVRAFGLHWRRLLVGAAAGWLVSTFAGAVILGYLAAEGVTASNVWAAVMVYGGIVSGMVVAWRRR